ncbi:hypothetical protein HD553DRAFT_324392 [Filobasidium floriforme]|uniref:uncharacterized protein n=1 Tax=Filobasidium floriforme TaxID=5210 RepID=UPI001E8ED46B|nr:uncharacterized protein HD553DRAFT_324392 [Filobasidium floriforme]KAH8083473.1 hypothetical protein HD553DRAFT_324392 [Filobasidium floriforme]
MPRTVARGMAHRRLRYQTVEPSSRWEVELYASSFVPRRSRITAFSVCWLVTGCLLACGEGVFTYEQPSVGVGACDQSLFTVGHRFVDKCMFTTNLYWCTSDHHNTRRYVGAQSCKSCLHQRTCEHLHVEFSYLLTDEQMSVKDALAFVQQVQCQPSFV